MTASSTRSWAGAFATLAVAFAVTSCGSADRTPDTPHALPSPSPLSAEPSPPVPSVASSADTTVPSSASSPSPLPSTLPTSATLVPPAPAPSTVSLPPNLCAGADRAQDAADAYVGALSAGQLDQAQACVFPGAVPTAVTTGLLAHQKQTAVYLPIGQSTGSDFRYQGDGKTVSVSVTREADGKFWVSKVQVQ